MCCCPGLRGFRNQKAFDRIRDAGVLTGWYRSSRNIQPTGVPAMPVVEKLALMLTDENCDASAQGHSQVCG
jgi:hypothetical protein